VFLLLISISCFNVYSQDKLEIEGTKILDDLVALRHLEIIDNQLIVTTRTDTLFSVFNTEKKTLHKFGREGFGPGELEKAPIFTVTYAGDILIYIDEQLEIRIIDIDKSIDTGKIIYDSIIEVPRKLRSLWSSQTYLVNDSTVVGMYDDQFDKVLDQKRGVLIYNINSKKVENYHLKNFSVQPFDVMSNTNVNARTGAAIFNQNKLIFAHHHTSLIETFDFQTRKLLSKNIIHDQSEFPKVFNNDKFLENGYREVFVNLSNFNGYSYILYSNTFYGEKVNKEILVVNSELEIVEKFTVNKKFELTKISAFQNVIYGMSYNNDEIYKFEL